VHCILLRCLELCLTIYDLSQYTIAFFIRCNPFLNVEALYTNAQRLVVLVGVVDLLSSFSRLGVDWVIRRRSFLDRLVKVALTTEMTVTEAA
jgi:hypothetical protein